MRQMRDIGSMILFVKTKLFESYAQALGFVLATGLLPPVSKTASHVFECLRLRLAPNRKMSLMQELLKGANGLSA